MSETGLRWLLGVVPLLAACTSTTVSSLGRPCSATVRCGPDAICDLVQGVCVAASVDRGQDQSEARPGDAPLDLADLMRMDQPGLSDTGCAGLTRCGSVCVDLSSSAAHCGACDKACGVPTGDHCASKTCLCGATGAGCPSGTACAAGKCDPNPCLGKKDGDPCDDKLYCTVNDACKSGVCVGPPRDCSAMSSTCAVGTCDEATDQCVAEPGVTGTPCGNGGQCYAGSCCSGCWTGSTCESGSALSACGDQGDLCQDCTSLECRSSAGTSCFQFSHPCTTFGSKQNGTPCTGGRCLEGACCTGCRAGDSCRPGTYSSACGAAGATCADCTSECRTGATCTGGSCVDPLKPDGASCTGGKCSGGSCCQGCIATDGCHSGQSSNNCGSGGGPCTTCPTTSIPCKRTTCTSGSCGIGDASDGTSCTGGTCHGGSCCTGCWSSSTGTCSSGTQNTSCGSGGGACTDCTASSLVCTNNVCG